MSVIQLTLLVLEASCSKLLGVVGVAGHLVEVAAHYQEAAVGQHPKAEVAVAGYQRIAEEWSQVEGYQVPGGNQAQRPAHPLVQEGLPCLVEDSLHNLELHSHHKCCNCQEL